MDLTSQPNALSDESLNLNIECRVPSESLPFRTFGIFGIGSNKVRAYYVKNGDALIADAANLVGDWNEALRLLDESDLIEISEKEFF